MTKNDCEHFIAEEMENKIPILIIGGTKVYEFEDALIIVSKKKPHRYIVIDDDIRIINLLKIARKHGFYLAYRTFYNDFFLEKHRTQICHFYWLLWVALDDGTLHDAINHPTNKRISCKSKRNKWDCRRDNLVITFLTVKNRRTRLTQKDIQAVGGLIAEDEIFKPVKGESGIYVSNYARLLSLRRTQPHLITPQFRAGYYIVTLQQTMYGKPKSHRYSLHRLVADAFVEKPHWIKPDDKTEVHHIEKIDKEKPIDGINNADNLMWIPSKLHKIVDMIETLYIKKKGKWHKCDFLEASIYYNMSPYDFLYSISGNRRSKPTRKYGKYYYYHKIVEHDGIETEINVKVSGLTKK